MLASERSRVDVGLTPWSFNGAVCVHALCKLGLKLVCEITFSLLYK